MGTFLDLRQDFGGRSVHERLFRRDAETSTRDAALPKSPPSGEGRPRLLLIADFADHAHEFGKILPVARSVIQCAEPGVGGRFGQKNAS
jgi:hypothetical protein